MNDAGVAPPGVMPNQQNFADAEQADHRDQEIKAAQQFIPAENQAWLPGHGIKTHRRQRESQHHGCQDLERRLLAHADEAAERQEIDREELRRAELQRETRDHRGKKCNEQHRK
jgi:hypothetical protein